ncbi:MAG: FAD-binding oxidoreductase [Bacillota bacterium]
MIQVQRDKVSEELLGEICPFRGNEDFYIDGILPKIILEPYNSQQVAGALALASRYHKPIALIGGGTKFHYGPPLEKSEWLLSTKYLLEEPIINTDDLTVVVKGGMTLADLNERLAKKGLFLPFDWELSKATVGGALAYGSGGSHRLTYGLVKDSVLGITVALTDGKVYRLGGKTVKNVAGYDMAKLFIGSKGTIGVITEACLRVYAFPPSSKVLLFTVKNKERLSQITKFLTELQPAVYELYDLALANKLFSLDIPEGEDYLALVKYSGPTPTVENSCLQTLEYLQKHRLAFVKGFNKEDEKSLWQKRIRFFEDNSIRLRVMFPAANLQKYIELLDGLAGKYRTKINSLYMPALGIANSIIELENTQLLNHFQTITGNINGTLVIESGPVPLRKSFQHNSGVLDGQIKKFFDPHLVLNYGKKA